MFNPGEDYKGFRPSFVLSSSGYRLAEDLGGMHGSVYISHDTGIGKSNYMVLG
jgi:hypothetical protein